MSEAGRQNPIKKRDMELKCLECGSNVVFARNIAIEYIDKPNTYRIKEQFFCIRSMNIAYQNGQKGNYGYEECTPLEVWSGEIRNKTGGRKMQGPSRCGICNRPLGQPNSVVCNFKKCKEEYRKGRKNDGRD